MEIPEVDATRVLKFKALSEPTRLKMIPHLSEPRTVKQVADILGIDHHSLYHHMRVLEKAGIVAMVSTKNVGNIKEKYYQLVDNWVVMKETEDNLGEIIPLARKTAITILEDMNLSIQNEKESATVHRVFVSVKRENLIKLKRHINDLIEKFIEEMQVIEDKDGDLLYSINFLHFLTPGSTRKIDKS